MDFPYLDPTDEERQRALSQALRKQETLGFLGQLSGDRTLSQVGGSLIKSAGAGQELAEHGTQKRLALAMAKLQQDAAEKEHALDNTRADAGQAETKRHNAYNEAHPQQTVVVTQGGNLVGVPTRVGTGPPTVLPSPGGGEPLKKNQPLDESAIEKLRALDEEAANVTRLGLKFKDEFSGSGPVGAMLVKAAQAAGSWAPKKAAGFAPQLSREAANFWSEYDRMVTLPQRNKLFGASLTPSEGASWERARTIKPGADPEDIRAAWEEMRAIAIRKPASARAQYAQQGYNPSDPAQAMGSGAPPAAQAAKVPMLDPSGKRFMVDASEVKDAEAHKWKRIK